MLMVCSRSPPILLVIKMMHGCYRAEADPKLEMVAHTTGGKTFTVNDVDEGHMLEDAFDGALTYQPPPPRKDTLVTVCIICCCGLQNNS